MRLHSRRQCDKSNKHIVCVQKPGKLSSEAAFTIPRCGLAFFKLKRDRNVTAVRKKPEIPLLCSSNCQEIRTHNSRRHLWLRFRHGGQPGKRMRSGVRQPCVLTLTSSVTLGKALPSGASAPSSGRPSSYVYQAPAAGLDLEQVHKHWSCYYY